LIENINYVLHVVSGGPEKKFPVLRLLY